MKYVTSDKTPKSENHATLQDFTTTNRTDNSPPDSQVLDVLTGEYKCGIFNSISSHDKHLKLGVWRIQ